MERSKYIVDQKLHSLSINEDENKVAKNSEIEYAIQTLEKKKSTLKNERNKLKDGVKRVEKERLRLGKQRNDLSAAIDKIYSVDDCLNMKLKEMNELQNTLKESIGNDPKNDDHQRLMENIFIGGLQEVERNLVELLQQVKSDF